MGPASAAYTSVAKWLHWLMALVIVAAWGIGYYAHEFMPKGPERTGMFGVHKAIGTAVLLLIVLRMAWRATHPAPSQGLAPWLHNVSRAAHGVLYFLMLAMPITGWLMTSAKGRDVHFLGLWQLPALLEKNADLARLFEDAHKLMAWVILSLVLAHVLAALHHHFIRRDGVLRSMLPGR